MGMDVLENAPAFIDNGTAPEFFANGLHEVEVMGSVCRFVLYLIRRATDGSEYREVIVTVIMPNDAVGPAVALTLRRLGAVGAAAMGTAAKTPMKEFVH